MRVYEFAKEYDVSSKDIINLLKDAGFDVGNHMSVLDDKACAYLEKEFGAGKAKAPNPAVPQPVAAIEIVEAPVLEALERADDEEEEIVPVVHKREPVKKLKSSEDLPEKEAPFVKKLTPSRPSRFSGHKKHRYDQPVEEKKAPETLVVRPMTPAELSDIIHHPVTEIIVTLMRWGSLVAKNQVLSEDFVARLAEHYQIKTERPERKEEQREKGTIIVKEGDFQVRPPVVVVMGHVDHGKTTLLDFIRNTRVASREKGGITQHLGAYRATTGHGDLVFLDTPGHEAFSKIRMRGIKVADLAVLIVAADDGIMPQTIEAIKFAKSMQVPIVVAVNKMDKVDESRLQNIKQGLSQQDLLAEDWGGDIVVVPISAKTGKGVDQLLEMLILQAQLLELKAEVKGAAKGYVLESKLEKGRGAVATILSQHGVMKVGDYFACGSTWGRISSIVDSFGKRLQQAGPTTPVQVAGFDELPQSGDYFEVVDKADLRKTRHENKEKRAASVSNRLTYADSVKLIVKSDTHSTQEAVLDSIERLGKKIDKPFNIISFGIGDVSEGDVTLASTTGSFVYGLHVKAEPNAASLAQQFGVSIQLYDIIYKLLEALEAYVASTKKIPMVRVKTGEAEVRKIFNIKGIGVIAGCYLKDGKFSRDGIIVGWRGRTKLGEGKIKSLQRDKKSVKEVHVGYEFAFMIDTVQDWQDGDRVECFVEIPEGTSLSTK